MTNHITKKEDDDMEIIKHYLTKNRCYKAAAKITPKGIVVHSTGCNNKNVTRYVDDPSLGDVSVNHWNTSNTSMNKCVHAMIGWSSTKQKVVVVNTLPYTYRPWGCGSGKNGTYNNSHIQFEICEDAAKASDSKYFNEAYKSAVEYCVYLCKLFKLNVNTIVSHKEANAKGYATPHEDADKYFKVFGKSMNQFRKDVTAAMNSNNDNTSTPNPSPVSVLYNVRVTTDVLNVRKGPGTTYDKVSTVKEGDMCKIVEELSGWGKLNTGLGWISLKYTEKVYSFKVKITANALNVRKGPSTDYGIVTTVKKAEVYTIVEEKNGWGKLKSGAGWISLKYTEKV